MNPNKPNGPFVRLLGGIVVVLGPIAIAWVCSLFTDIGREAHDEYLTVIPQVIPVVFLAALLEARATAARAASVGDVSERLERTIRDGFLFMVCLFIGAEGVALYAVAADTATTFTVFAPLLTGLQLLLMMLGDIPSGIGLAPTMQERDATLRREFGRRMEKTAQAYEDRARRIREQAADLEQDAPPEEHEAHDPQANNEKDSTP